MSLPNMLAHRDKAARGKAVSAPIFVIGRARRKAVVATRRSMANGDVTSAFGAGTIRRRALPTRQENRCWNAEADNAS
jgi:hypothetical protein